jgi:hypothetical protein
MQPRLSTPQEKRKPKFFFGLISTNLSMLNNDFELKTTYASIVSYYKFYMALDRSSKAHDAKAAKKVISRCDSSLRKAHLAWKRAKGEKIAQKKIVARILSSVKTMRYQFYLLVSTYNKIMKPADKAILPTWMILTYTLDEIRDFGCRLLHRIDSNYLYDESKEKEQLYQFLEITLDSAWSKYLKETRQAGDAGSASKIIFSIFEYAIILIYKIDDGCNLMQFSQLQSETTSQTSIGFKELKKQAI